MGMDAARATTAAAMDTATASAVASFTAVLLQTTMGKVCFLNLGSTRYPHEFS